jgi:hypothetical protein
LARNPICIADWAMVREVRVVDRFYGFFFNSSLWGHFGHARAGVFLMGVFAIFNIFTQQLLSCIPALLWRRTSCYV